MRNASPNWLPIRAALRPDGLLVALRDIKPHELRDAFMQETVARLSGADQLLQVSRADLLKPVTGPQPAGLVFHVARCGSTLVSQTLKQFDGVTVYAEPLPFNEVLLPPHAGSRAEMVGALRALGAALARHAGGPFIIKFSSWNTLFCDLLVEAFPATPWALCLRNPAEVAVSLLRETPGWLRESEQPAQRLARVVDPEATARSREEYLARLYGAFCDAANRLDRQLGLLVDYKDLPTAIPDRLVPHFSLPPVDARLRARLLDAAKGYSKAPIGKASSPFTPDSGPKRAAVSPALRQAVDQFARSPLARLTAGR